MVDKKPSNTIGKIRKLSINLAILLASFFIMIIIIEGFFLIFPATVPESIDYLARGRVYRYDPEMFAVLKPNINKEFYLRDLDKNITVKTVPHNTEIGFRDDQDDIENHKRILILGDSFTFGTGVDSKDTFVSNLESQLADEGINVDVINGGVVGYSSKLELAHYKRFSQKLNPDMIIVALWENDFNDNYIYEHGKFMKIRAWLGRNSMIYNLISTTLNLMNKQDMHYAGLKKREKLTFDQESDLIKEGYRIERENILELSVLAKEDNAKLILLILPGTQNIHTDHLYKEGDGFILMDMSSETFKIADLLHPIHGHYTEESAKSVAALIKEGILKDPDLKEVLKDG